MVVDKNLVHVARNVLDNGWIVYYDSPRHYASRFVGDSNRLTPWKSLENRISDAAIRLMDDVAELIASKATNEDRGKSLTEVARYAIMYEV